MFKDAIRFVQEAREELRKVTWPSRDEVTSFTVIVVITVLIVSLFLWMIDTGLMLLIRTVMN
jgi:preprotein translocase subunit SecE